MAMDYKRRSKSKLSMRNSVIIWVGGAFLGWALMVVTVYNVLRFPDSQVAENGRGNPMVIASDEKSLNEIAPAAGGNLSPAEDALAPAEDTLTEETGEETKDADENIDDIG